MASEDDIARLRRMTALAADDAIYTDELLSAMIDELGFEAAAAAIWREKAAAVSSMVDITESGSSRRFSQLRDAYLGMAGAVHPDEDITTGGSFTVPIERV